MEETEHRGGAADVDGVLGLDDQQSLDLICQMLEAKPQLASSVAQYMIPDLTFAPARAVTEQRRSGVIKNFDMEKGYGFIDCPEVKEAYGCDVWLHHEQAGAFGNGSYVEFAVLLSKGGKPQGFGLTAGKGSQTQDAPALARAVVQIGGVGGATAVGSPFSPPRGMKRPRASGEEGQRYVGTIKNFHVDKGFGFIECPELFEVYGIDTWLHHAQLQHFQLGQTVEFTMALNKDGKPQAVDLALEGSQAKKGAISITSPYGKGGVKGQIQSTEEGQRYVGTIKNFHVDKGFGFIECPELFEVYGIDTWLHHAQLQHFQLGQTVEFTMALNKDGKPQAMDLSLAGTPATKGTISSTSPYGKGGVKGQLQSTEEGQRYLGTIKNFHVDKGFGFIECPELFEVYGIDTWLHHAQLQHFQPGDTVEFTMALNKDGKPQAVDLALEGGPAQKAAPLFCPPAFVKGRVKGATESGEQGQRYVGTIKNFHIGKGFGFIECPELFEVYGRDTWLHHAQLQNFQPGQTVEFTMALNKDGNPQAVDLTLPPDVLKKVSGKAVGGKAVVQATTPAWKGAGKHLQASKGKGQVEKSPKLGELSDSGDTVETPSWLQPVDDTRYTGVLASVSPEKGFGFIDCSELKEAYGKDTWVHKAQIRSFQVGDSVAFSLILNQQGHPQAINLESFTNA